MSSYVQLGDKNFKRHGRARKRNKHANNDAFERHVFFPFASNKFFLTIKPKSTQP